MANRTVNLADTIGLGRDGRLGRVLGRETADALDAVHMGAAAGLTSVLKTALCLYQEIIPPLSGFREPSDPTAWTTTPFYMPLRPAARLHDRANGPRVAGVSRMTSDGRSGPVLAPGVDPHDRIGRGDRHLEGPDSIAIQRFLKALRGRICPVIHTFEIIQDGSPHPTWKSEQLVMIVTRVLFGLVER